MMTMMTMMMNTIPYRRTKTHIWDKVLMGIWVHPKFWSVLNVSHICFGPICNALKTCDGETSFKCCQSPGASFQFFTVWETAFTRVQNPSPSTDWDQLYFIITVVVNITIHHRPEAHSRRRAMEAVVSWNVAAFYELIIRGIYAYIYQASREASLGSQF